ncbi:YbhB/YbcL family Raf kinase inhibitor-like protein [Suttonella sp. R2A3]|uniref:YbhB/YbcL family Raf kinase inhibitor-like protein n=1 Tax=Suttonella sp. R2A3 TaxID=2908648 RepID=UPI001F3813ED|nr:YbhB/YbcL family Raf kinase inhibitor-like protein [Suttonella sp. R2A3]UJF25059.1 YbhB/YbcL family Raf kinase inhibitor-like protein [Suttonella sp. R2A3]
MSQFILTSPTIKDGDTLPNTHVFNDWGYSGDNQSPELHWQGAPEGTKSFAISCYDPDAPTGSGFWHWYVINLPADCTHLKAGAGNPASPQLPSGARQMNNDIAQKAFVGAFPPQGDKPHRYIFTVYALGVDRLELPENATTAFAGFNVLGNTLAQASFTAYYGR